MTDFKVGDTVYFISDNEIKCSIIIKSNVNTILNTGGNPIINKSYWVEEDPTRKFSAMDLFNSFDDLVDFYREYLKNTNRYK